MKKAIAKKGFSFVEIITPCPEEYGRRNKIADPILGMKLLREVSEVRSHIAPIDAVVGPDKIIVGEFVDIEKPEYSDLLWEQNRSIQAGLDKTGRRTIVAL
jgi:2-oxoglutarate ferredoxin oxidoreductase subunit beta